jgi:hypothetical protein
MILNSLLDKLPPLSMAKNLNRVKAVLALTMPVSAQTHVMRVNDFNVS